MTLFLDTKCLFTCGFKKLLYSCSYDFANWPMHATPMPDLQLLNRIFTDIVDICAVKRLYLS